MNKLIILDFQKDEVDIYNIDPGYEPDMEDLLDKLGHRTSDCQWMFSAGKITFHSETLEDDEA